MTDINAIKKAAEAAIGMHERYKAATTDVDIEMYGNLADMYLKDLKARFDPATVLELIRLAEIGRAVEKVNTIRTLEENRQRLVSAATRVLEISDRKHDAWDELREALREQPK